MSIQETMERATVRSLMKLPGPLAGRMAGLIERVHRHHLDPRLRLLLALGDGRKGFHQLPLKQSRALYGRIIRNLDVKPEKVGRQVDFHVAGDDGHRLLIRCYRPKGAASPAPAVMFYHGGGYTIGSAAEYDGLCRYIANHTGAVVFNVDYRLAPEYPAPTAADDAINAWQWLDQQADELGVDRSRMATMGDSAGGCLCLVAAQQAALRGFTVPRLAVAVYPTTDGGNDSESTRTLGDGQGGLDREMMNWFRGHYLQDEALATDLRLSPLHNSDFSAHPATVIATATDPLRDEGLAYGEKLRQAGVTVVSLDYPELVHGFITMGGAIPAARRALDALCREIRERL